MTGSAEAQKSTGNILEGMDETNPRTDDAAALGDSKFYCIPLLSGIGGCMQNKYVPPGDMSGGDLRLEITLAN